MNELLRTDQAAMREHVSIRSETRRLLTLLVVRASTLDRVGAGLLRLALVIVPFWIGGLKFASYEAESIVPLVANSHLMSLFYHFPAPDYRAHTLKEGEANAASRQWHEENRTYSFSYGLGTSIILIGLLIALHPMFPRVAKLGSLLLIFMSFTTLSFLITTPEAWMPALGGAAHGFPYLSGVGRLVVRDIIMMGAAVVTMADAARTYLQR